MIMWDDYSLPIKFNIEENDVVFAEMFMVGDDFDSWFLAIEDNYSELFYVLDLNPSFATTFNPNIPLVTDMIESE